METLAPIYEDCLLNDQLHRHARRINLNFYINRWDMVVWQGHSEPNRPATDAELDMWRVLLPKFEGVLPADPREFRGHFYAPGFYYLCAEDFAVLRQGPEFKACLERSALTSGYRGTFQGANIYVSRAIPRGYYLAMQNEAPELNWHPSDQSNERELAPELDARLRAELEANLQPLLV